MNKGSQKYSRDNYGAHAMVKQPKRKSVAGTVVVAGAFSIAIVAGMGMVTANAMNDMLDNATAVKAVTATIDESGSMSSSTGGSVSDKQTQISTGNETTESNKSSENATSNSSNNSTANDAAKSDSSEKSSSNDSSSNKTSSSDSESTQSYTYAGGKTYHIKYGDTLSAISLETGVSVQKLAAVNDIDNVNLIYANSSLEIPQD